MIPRFPLRYRRIDLVFLMPVSLARPRLDEASPSHSASQLGRSTTVFQQAVWRLRPLAGIPFSSVSRRSQRSVGELFLERGHVELLRHAFHIRSINSQVVPFLRFYQGSSQVARCFCRHLAAFELQVSAQFSEDYFGDLVRSSQQQMVQMEYE